MAIITNKTITGTGFKKVIDEDSLEMILDTLQVAQYSKPHASAIRECVSNAVDSEVEKETARNILTGVDTIEDHYDTSIIADNSGFDKDYYNLDFLTSESKVTIDFHVKRKDNKRALLRVTDHGVGLGGLRLEKSFNPGYSSKRGSNDTLGSFGLGAKAPLATGIEYYILTSFYNGRKYKFKIFVNKVDCLIPKFSKGAKNDFHKFENGFHAFYEETTEKNGVILEWEVKQHNIETVKSAITSQLMYFTNIEYILHEELYETKETIDLQTDVLYEDEDIVIPTETSNHTYKPHILLGKEGKYVNYNFIDWTELELPEYFGGIGFKLSPSEVSINPSRESLVWNERTKKAILDKFDDAKAIVNKQLTAKLTETNFIKWNRTVATILNNLHYHQNRYLTAYKQDDVVKVLSNLIDTAESFELKYNKTNYEFLDLNKSILPKDDKQGTLVRQISVNNYADIDVRRNSIHSWASFSDDYDVYITESERADKIKDLYIADNLGDDEIMSFKNNFILIHTNKIQKGKALDFILSSSNVKDYDTVEVPEKERALYQNKITLSEMTPAQQRKLDQKIVVKRFYSNYGSQAYTSKLEFKISEIPTKFADVKIIYGHRDDANLLEKVATILKKRTNPVVYLIAQNNIKHFKNHAVYVKDYIFQKDEINKTITLMPEIIEGFRQRYLATSDIWYEYEFIQDLSTVFKAEFELMNKIKDVEDTILDTTIDSFSIDIFKSYTTAKAINISFDEFGKRSFNNGSTYIQDLLDAGYTLNPIDIKEKKVIDRFIDVFKNVKSFLNNVSSIQKHEEAIETYLSAIEFKFLQTEELNELINYITEQEDDTEKFNKLFPESITLHSEI